MEARIIGPASELGQFDSLKFFDGQVTLTRDWSDINVDGEQLATLKANRYVELMGDEKDAVTRENRAEEDEKAVVKARLQELGVAFGGRSNLSSLKSKLDAAEKAQAKQGDEEDEILEQADEIRAERDSE